MQIFDYILQNIDSVPFANNVFQHHPSNSGKYASFYSFISKETIVNKGDYDVRNIVGGDKSKGTSWQDFLCNLNHEWYKLPEYDTSDNQIMQYFVDPSIRHEPVDPWTIHDINGVGYISEGHHRTTIAKFLHSLGNLPPEIKGIKYVKYMSFNEEDALRYTKLFRKIQEIKAIYSHDDFIRVEASREEVSKYIEENVTTIEYKPRFATYGDYEDFKREDGQIVCLQKVTYHDNLDEFETYINQLIKKETSSFRYKITLFFRKLFPSKPDEY